VDAASRWNAGSIFSVIAEAKFLSEVSTRPEDYLIAFRVLQDDKGSPRLLLWRPGEFYPSAQQLVVRPVDIFDFPGSVHECPDAVFVTRWRK
jgi:hypothetical protein